VSDRDRVQVARVRLARRLRLKNQVGPALRKQPGPVAEPQQTECDVKKTISQRIHASERKTVPAIASPAEHEMAADLAAPESTRPPFRPSPKPFPSTYKILEDLEQRTTQDVENILREQAEKEDLAKILSKVEAHLAGRDDRAVVVDRVLKRVRRR
jgi:hypothetical protein